MQALAQAPPPDQVSEELREGSTVFRYKRCSRFGYTVRHIVREMLDPALVDGLRRELPAAFSRLDYDLSRGAAGTAR